MKLVIPRGSTAQLARFLVRSQSTGLGVPSLAFNSAGLAIASHRAGDPTASPIALVAGTLGTWSSGGFALVDDARMPGLCEVGVPDATWLAGDPILFVTTPAGSFCDPLEYQVTAPDYTTAASVSAGGFTLGAADFLAGVDLSGWTVVVVAAAGGAGQAALIASSDTATNVQTLAGAGWSRGVPTGAVQYLLFGPFVDKSGYQIELAQSLLDTTAGTVGGALHGAWMTAWGKIVKDVPGRLLRAFGVGSQSVAARTFTLDDGNSPTSRTPQ